MPLMDERIDDRAFAKILRALSEQYECDIANALQRGKEKTVLEFHESSTNKLQSSVEGVTISQTSALEARLEAAPFFTNCDEPHVAENDVRSATSCGSDAASRSMEEGSQFAWRAVPTRLPSRLQMRKSTGKLSNERRGSGLGKSGHVCPFLAVCVRKPFFDKISAGLLLANAMFIGVQVEYSLQGEMPPLLDAMDATFTFLFVAELLMRIAGYGCAQFFFDPQERAWNIFDFIIVIVSLVDTITTILTMKGQGTPMFKISVLRVIRVVRLTRVLRIIRIMKFFQDLRILVAAICSTVKTASFAFILLLGTMYLFGIVVTQLVAEHFLLQKNSGGQVPQDDDLTFYFGSLWSTMFTMFMAISGGVEWKDAAMSLHAVNTAAAALFVVFVTLMVLLLLNVVTGIFCQCALETARTDQDNLIEYQLNEKQRYVKTLERLFSEWDESGNGTCSRQEFETHLADDAMQALLRSLDIEVRDALTLFNLLDSDGSGQIDLDEFVTGCITMRGGAKAVHLEKMNSMNKCLIERVSALEKAMKDRSKKMRSRKARSPAGVPSWRLAQADGASPTSSFVDGRQMAAVMSEDSVCSI